MMIVRATSPLFMTAEPVVDLLKRAYAKHPHVTWERALAGILPVLHLPTTGVFVGEEKGLLRAFALVFLPTSPLHSVPQVNYLYNEGSAKLRDQLVHAIFEYVTSAGYNRVWAINQVGNDKAHARLFRKVGPSRPIGSVLEIDLERTRGQPVRGRKQQHAAAEHDDAAGHDAGRVHGPAPAAR